ncbi:MAG: dTDP-glucose 4,6-dehydratase [archaeon]|nr:dTDP-glucose 4,6-dehydratase [archaeon]
MKNVLVTGGCGFIGSNFIKYLRCFGNYSITNLDALTYAGNMQNLSGIRQSSDYSFVNGDICNIETVNSVMKKFHPDYIINFAAESHVDRSIENSEDFIRTNVEGTRVLLDSALRNGVEKFVQIGTDEVYGSLDKESRSSTEKSRLNPRSPYSASKASADLLALSYFATHNLPICITRSSNNYGPNQFPEKVIPLFITNILEGKKVPVYGNGMNVRDWLYVRDNCMAIQLVLENGKPGEIYNIGGRNELTNMHLTEMILREMGFGDDWEEHIQFVGDRKGHDFRYSLNCGKIERELGWFPTIDFEAGLRETIEWYKKSEKWWKPLKERK